MMILLIFLRHMKIKNILSELKLGLTKLYDNQLVDVLLYGSYARGEQRQDLSLIHI